MKWSLCVILALCGFCFGLSQSPAQTATVQVPKPKPDWVGKFTDHGEYDPRLKGYLTPAGMKLEIVADVSTIVNPVAMSFGTEGTLHVLEWAAANEADLKESTIEVTYKDGTTRKVAVMKKPGKDRVKILIDKKDKGVYDEAKVVLEEESLAGILIHNGWLYASGQGTVRRYKQEKPEGPFGKKEVIAQGFGGLEQQQVSGLTIGPDGWLYITAGSGDHFVEGSDGSRVDILRTGAVFRCTPDGSKMHVFALGMQNPFGNVTFDVLGNLFHADNGSKPKPGSPTKPGSQAPAWEPGGCRLLHVAEEADFGWRLAPGTKGCQPDPIRAAAHGEKPGTLAPMLDIGPGTMAGLCIYADTFFPDEYHGVIFQPDMARQSIRAFLVAKQGATFQVTHEFDLMKSDDPFFRPCQMVVGPDGAIYVCDGGMDFISGKWSGDGKHGRIYRLSWTGTKEKPAIPLRGLDAWAKIAKQSDAELLKTLQRDNGSDRREAQQELVRRGDKNRLQLLKFLEDDNRPLLARVAALGALQSMWNKDISEAFQKLISHPELELCRLAAEGLARNVAKGDKAVHQCLIQVLDETDPAVKRALALAIGKVGAEGAADVLVNLLKFDNGKDRFLSDGIVRGLERLGKPGIDGLLALANSGVDKDLETVVKTFTALRCPAGADALPEILKNVHLSSKESVALIDSFRNYLFDPPIGYDSVIHHLETLVDLTRIMPVTPELKKKIEASKPVQLACLKLLAEANTLETPNTRKLVLAILGSKDHALQKGAIAALGVSPTGATLVGQQYLAKKLPTELMPQVAEALSRHAQQNPELASMLIEVKKGKKMD